MATLAVYDADRNKVGELEVSDDVFGVVVKEGVLHEVVQWQRAKRRAGTASTKGRGEVSGGGRKPWRQKGTGRARAGSVRSPLWRHGGVVFGPKPRDYGYALPKKVRRLALRMALSDKLRSDRITVLRGFGLERIKTKDMAALLRRFEVEKAVIVIDGRDEVVELSARNLPNVKVLPQDGLNVYDLLRYEHVILHEPAVARIQERLQP
ncbi:50S ribosomal protein L4 [Dissulfurirhabdus thermomarina]|uniref:Large ribosomal subunit protein uL4 n=1 Tax=Dissulfurirhabdus thermomarina TaxID=1765737 RepID=A0A6N9TJP4_DISTH|nr:50S ribosomal protein L4 [Dissulfurirhabdus thermomarina]NDY41309.1 50S ribosomal protein L4 [Dissulfurirhabdus thermomarina]NMX23308.1 50S ribosomal protein L4 [Dissulfurirhabdus thermomarina]